MTKKVLVAGAGIGGLCAALALAKRGFEVVVYEQSTELAEVGAGLQLSPNAMHVLVALGLSAQLKTLAFQPQAAVMRHYQSGECYFTVPLGQQATDKYGADYLHIHRADLHKILLQACLKIGVSIHLGQAIQNYSQFEQRVSVNFTNGQSIQGDVVIGADGIKSKVQAAMLGQLPAQFSGQVAWRAVVETNKLPKGLIKPNANLWVGTGQHFVSYYLRGGELVNFVAVQERTNWQNESWHEQGDITQLQSSFAGWHPEVTELLAATEQCFLWALFQRQPLKQWADNNVALLGDACHPMVPFLAQGAAMAIEDSYALAFYLAEYNDTSVALNHYQNLRLKRTSDMQANAYKNAKLYHMSTSVERSKLAILAGLAKVGLSDTLAAKKLDFIYAYNIVKQLD
jgi:salicylate hydroxylase